MESLATEQMAERIELVAKDYPWLVLEENGEVIGYAYAASWKKRAAYRYSVESSVYLKNGHSGKGAGSKLYAALIDKLKQMEVHAIIGGITLPNDPSIHLHEKFGFEKIGEFKEVGFKFNDWRNVGYWQLILDEE